MNKALITAAVLTAGALAATVWYAGRPQTMLVRVAEVTVGSVAATVSNTRAGTVDACRRARLAPIMGGQIDALPVKEGDLVLAGQPLMELWNDDVQAQVELAAQQLAAARARAESACVASRVASRTLQRLRRLNEQGLTSAEAINEADGNAASALAQCSAMTSMIAVAEAEVRAREAAAERTILRAPFDGTVAEINGELGEVVTPSPVGVATLPAVDLIDNSCIFVRAPIDEIDAPAISQGMSARVTLDAFREQRFPARVRRIAPYVRDYEKQARTVDIEVEFDQADPRFLPGYSADVEVIIDRHDEVLTVPSQALTPEGRVWVVRADGTLESRVVQPGLRNWELTEVVDGLAAGERVVISSSREEFADGLTVSVE